MKSRNLPENIYWKVFKKSEKSKYSTENFWGSWKSAWMRISKLRQLCVNITKKNLWDLEGKNRLAGWATLVTSDHHLLLVPHERLPSKDDKIASKTHLEPPWLYYSMNSDEPPWSTNSISKLSIVMMDQLHLSTRLSGELTTSSQTSVLMMGQEVEEEPPRVWKKPPLQLWKIITLVTLLIKLGAEHLINFFPRLLLQQLSEENAQTALLAW